VTYLGILLTLTGMLGGCFSLQSGVGLVRPEHSRSVATARAPQPEHEAPVTPAFPPADRSQAAQPPVVKDLWARLRAGFRFQGIKHPRINREIKRLVRHPQSFEALVQRSTAYLYYIVEQVEERGLPGEVALLPAVESGFQPYAYSSNGAAGLWQFMPATGRMLGLKQDRVYDGRRDVAGSTEAALHYLTRLHDRLDSNWLYALAAYNCGIGTVEKALRKAERHGRSTSYWKLDLPGETDAYVPRLLAMAHIVANPQEFGVELPELPNEPYFETAEVDGALDLKLAAELAHMPLEELLALNPGYRSGTTLAKGSSPLLLPAAQRPVFEQALERLPRDKWLRWADHRIRKGDTLIGIARRYHVSVAAIREANGIHGSFIRAGKRLQIPLSGRASDRARKIAAVRSKVRYKVRKGDSLYKIARRFSVSIKDLKRWNRVGRYLHPGQRLTVYVNHAG
jgi:membrane-bound lytic murein transglycosylase D